MALKLTDKQIKEAIKNTSGFISVIAKKLGVDWHTVDKRIKKSEELQLALLEETETRIDFAESKLNSNINAGKETSIIFFLKTRAKSRGYIEKQELQVDSHNETKVSVSFGERPE